ncbi:hypothetical protein FZC66_16300 [Priestia megaterium]|nr:hypothetical protein FZC66_16300 [Priestia megaterium]
MNSNSWCSPSSYAAKKPFQFSTWIWDTKLIETKREQLIISLKEKHVSRVYLQVNQQLSSAVYQAFIAQAAEAGIRIYALDGAPEWGSSPKGEQQAFFEWLSVYQEHSLPTQRFAGIHLDVEPYLHSHWEQSQMQLLTSYQQLINDSVAKAQVLQLPLGVDIPF